MNFKITQGNHALFQAKIGGGWVECCRFVYIFTLTSIPKSSYLKSLIRKHLLKEQAFLGSMFVLQREYLSYFPSQSS